MVLEVRLDGVAATGERVLVALVVAAEARVELELGAVADLADTAGDRHADVGTVAVGRVVVVAAPPLRDPRGSRAPAASRARSAPPSPWRRTRRRSRCATRSGNPTAHSSARMPPIEPPTTAAQRSMPRCRRATTSTTTWSRIVITREARAVRAAVGRGSTTGRSCPGTRRARSGTRRRTRSVSIGAPGPDHVVPPAVRDVTGPGRARRRGCRR